MGFVSILLSPTGRLYMLIARYGWSRNVMKISGIDLGVKGIENINPDKTYVICANHQSQVDIPVLFAALPMPIRFLAKRSLFYIPLFGWSLYLAGFVPIDRGSSSRARKSLRRGAQRIKTGPCLMVFPEGTRSPDGKIHDFMSGAFTLAIKSGVPILPVAIRGSYEIVPKSTLNVQPGPVELVIGSPFSTDGMTMKDNSSLRIRTQEAVTQMFETGRTV
jgi:1-acyl-sn-glycerol-3-phosphate acyltransferase